MEEGKNRRIAHLDMDAFYAAVEQRDFPAYRNRPVIVGGLGPRGVVSTASYEARRYGVRSAMPMALARKRCPDGIYLRPRFERYKEVSSAVRAIISLYSPVVETVSLDEAFFDLSGHGSTFSSARAVAEEIKRRVRTETGLTCSVGIASNRFLAKVASELDKPDGLKVIEPERVQETLDPLPVGAIWGVGRVTERRLKGLGLITVRDLRLAPLPLLIREFGRMGRRLHELSCGIDETPLGREAIEAEVRRLARSVARRLRDSSLLCRTVRIKVRYPDFRTVTRQVRLGVGIDSEGLIETVAVYLLRERVALDEQGVRLIGVGAAHLSETTARQLPLFQ